MRGNMHVVVHSGAQVLLACSVSETCVIYKCHSIPDTCILCLTLGIARLNSDVPVECC